MPTDYPRKSPPEKGFFITKINLAFVDLRLKVSIWRLDRARSRYDHYALLRHLEVWAALQDRRTAYLGQRVNTGAARACDESYGRIRATVCQIDRESRRLAWATARMQRAYSAQDQRAYSHAQHLGRLACVRLKELWASL